MLIEVKNCYDCPFCNNDDEWGFSCKVPSSEVNDWEILETGLPEKCPLNEGPIQVSKPIYNHG